MCQPTGTGAALRAHAVFISACVQPGPHRHMLQQLTPQYSLISSLLGCWLPTVHKELLQAARNIITFLVSLPFRKSRSRVQGPNMKIMSSRHFLRRHGAASQGVFTARPVVAQAAGVLTRFFAGQSWVACCAAFWARHQHPPPVHRWVSALGLRSRGAPSSRASFLPRSASSTSLFRWAGDAALFPRRATWTASSASPRLRSPPVALLPPQHLNTSCQHHPQPHPLPSLMRRCCLHLPASSLSQSFASSCSAPLLPLSWPLVCDASRRGRAGGTALHEATLFMIGMRWFSNDFWRPMFCAGSVPLSSQYKCKPAFPLPQPRRKNFAANPDGAVILVEFRV